MTHHAIKAHRAHVGNSCGSSNLRFDLRALLLVWDLIYETHLVTARITSTDVLNDDVCFKVLMDGCVVELRPIENFPEL